MQTWRWEYSLIAAAMVVAGMLLIAGLHVGAATDSKGSVGKHANDRIAILAAT